jgi:hypothetical protein
MTRITIGVPRSWSEKGQDRAAATTVLPVDHECVFPHAQPGGST